MGASLVFGIAWLFPKDRRRQMRPDAAGGQILSAMVLSHYGWLGSPVAPVSLSNAMGALLMIGGVYLATR